MSRRLVVAALLVLGAAHSVTPRAQGLPPLQRSPGAQPRNVIFVLVDDLRYDALGYMGHPWIETPHVAERVVPQVVHRSEEHTSELQSPCKLVCRLLLEKKNIFRKIITSMIEP